MLLSVLWIFKPVIELRDRLPTWQEKSIFVSCEYSWVSKLEKQERLLLISPKVICAWKDVTTLHRGWVWSLGICIYLFSNPKWKFWIPYIFNAYMIERYPAVTLVWNYHRLIRFFRQNNLGLFYGPSTNTTDLLNNFAL